MKFPVILIPLITLSGYLHAQQMANNTQPIAIVKRVIDIDYPSASAGLMKDDDNWWILGDDAAYVLRINPSIGNSYLTTPYKRPLRISDSNKGKDARTVKQTKLDWECFASFSDSIHEHIWAFGSGSKKNKRDSGIYWLDGVPSKMSLDKLYEYLQMKVQLSERDWNIEGAACSKNAIYLLNRRPSLLIWMPMDEWMRFIQIGELPKTVNYTTIVLPKINNFSAGLSGATFDSKRNSIFFTSSVEVTDDPVRDGEILGSFVGEIKLSEPSRFEWISRLQDDSSNFMVTKLESICIPPQKKNTPTTLFRCTSDNDDGTSQLLHIEVEIP